MWCFFFRFSFPDKVRKNTLSFFLCLPLKLDFRVFVLGSWGNCVYCDFVMELFSSHYLPAGFAFMPAPPFDVRWFQEPQLQLHFSQEFFKPLYEVEKLLKIWIWWHITDRIPFLTFLRSYIVQWWNLNCQIIPPELL